MAEQLVFDKSWIPRRILLKNFVTEHRRMLGFVGALIVFVTFMVKDGLREELKDLVSSIDSAEDVFAIRNDSSTTAMWLQRLQEQVDWVAEKTKLKGTSYSGDMVERTHSSLEITREQHESIAMAFENIRRLIEKLHGRKKEEEQLAALEKRLEAAREEHDVLALKFGREPMSVLWAIAPLLNETEAISEDTRQLAKDLLGAAATERKHRETVYGVSTWASYLLYTLGWSLGLAGRIFGISDLEGGAE
jgi:hypothetical protein